MTDAAHSGRPYDGHSAIVFGGTSGIGAATAVLLAERGAAVAVVGRRRSAGEAVAERCRSAGSEAIDVVADVTDESQVAAAVAAATDAHGPLTMAVNSAAIDLPALFTEQTEVDAETAIGVNVEGMWRCLRHEIEAMVDTGRGSIVNVGSIAGSVPVLGNAVYCATKAAVTALTRSAAYEYAAAGIRVNEVAPGTTRSELLDDWLESVAGDQGLGVQDLERCIPLGHLADPREQATVIAFLLSDEASFVTGTSLLTDGGMALNTRIMPTSDGRPPETPGDVVARARRQA
ncbi:MAG: SDR family oxidoreductase [Acidimicrobiia bacterium]|nr:SDR family oxidoreductase [Acidimicrobiia bacterium]